MKNSKFVLFCVSFFLMFATSCNLDKSSPELSTELLNWKSDNETYFVNMKDSTDYTKYEIPAIRGGNSFYYKITTPGNPDSGSPAYNNIVEVNYRGKLINGYIFDHSFIGNNPMNDSTARPIKYFANGFISGWTENLIQMKEGEIRRIILPQELSYGTLGYGIIPAFSTLIFDVQLISFGQ